MKKLLFILLLLPLVSVAQISTENQAKVDSLKQVVKTAEHDSLVIKSWITWDNIIYITDPELDFTLNLKIDSLCTINLDKNPGKQEKLFFLKSKGFALNNIGMIYQNQNDYIKAMDCYTKSLTTKEEIGDKKGMAKSLNNIGIIYKDQGDHVKAIDHYTKSLTIREEIGDKKGISTS